jgi:DNA-binding MarR family transcriptional regulator
LRAFSAKVIATGLAREIRAKETSPIWRTDVATGRAYTLTLTTKGEGAAAKSEPKAGSRAKIAAEQPDVAATAKAGKRPGASSRAAAGAEAKGLEADNSDARSEPRANSKLALVLGLLSRDPGATMAELMAATGWLPHTTRAALTRLRQRGFRLERFKGGAGCASIFRARVG